MKTLIKSLLVSFILSVVTVSASLAESNSGNHQANVASYKTGIHSTAAGKLNIALDKETTGAVDIKLTNAKGQVLFTQHITKREKMARIRLNMDQLPDGAYQVAITNGVDTTTHSLTLSTSQPSTPDRLVAVN